MNLIVTKLLDRLMVWLCGGQLWTRAQAWVQLYEQKDLTGAEKRERVAEMLRTELETLGLDVAQSLIHLALEAAVQAVRRRSA